MSTITTLLDRIHAINTEIQAVASGLTLNPRRYFQGYEAIASLPSITPLLPQGTHNNETYGSDTRHDIWSVPILMFVDNFIAGAGPENAQENCELCTDHLLDEYWNRPRLELDDSGALNGIMADARLTANTQIEVANNSIAIIRFTLVVETIRDIERI